MFGFPRCANFEFAIQCPIEAMQLMCKKFLVGTSWFLLQSKGFESFDGVQKLGASVSLKPFKLISNSKVWNPNRMWYNETAHARPADSDLHAESSTLGHRV